MRDHLERQVDSELQFHIERQVRDYMNSGMSEEEARRTAHLTFGGLDHIQEEGQDARGIVLISTLIQDLPYALRTFREESGFRCHSRAFHRPRNWGESFRPACRHPHQSVITVSEMFTVKGQGEQESFAVTYNAVAPRTS